MTMHVKHPKITFPRWQFGSLALAAAVVMTPVFSAAHETTTSHPPTSSSMPMDHAGMDHMKVHGEGMGHMKAHEGMSMTGDVDFDFAVNMRKHHQMALMMSEAQLKSGKDAAMRELATQVIAAQKKEIDELDKWLAEREDAKISQSVD